MLGDAGHCRPSEDTEFHAKVPTDRPLLPRRGTAASRRTRGKKSFSGVVLARLD